MANALFPLFKQTLLSGGPNLTTDTINAALVSNAATFNSANQFWSSYSANVVGTPQAIGSKTVTSGVFNGAGVTYTAVAAGSTVGAIVIYDGSPSTDATRPLIAWIDTGSGGSISVVTNGGNITITWDSGANKIFAL
jgi:hypothetical protein